LPVPAGHRRGLQLVTKPKGLTSVFYKVLDACVNAISLFGVAPWVVFGLYLTRFVIIILVGLMLRPFRFGEPEPFI